MGRSRRDGLERLHEGECAGVEGLAHDRALEPLRGFHRTTRALPDIIARHPRAEGVSVGGEGTSYGASPPAGTTWKAVFLDEVARRLDLSRVHFLGRVDYETYLQVLRVSAAHVYLTYPFVLSWSMLEAMAAGCLVVGSATPPVREVIDGTNGILVDFFRPDRIAAAVLDALEGGRGFDRVRERARDTVVRDYDSRRCVTAARAVLEGRA